MAKKKNKQTSAGRDLQSRLLALAGLVVIVGGAAVVLLLIGVLGNQGGGTTETGIEIEKVELAMKLELERRPKRAASSKPVLDETIPLVKKAIEQAAATGDGKVYDDAMGRLRTDCMKCHVDEDVPHFTVYFSKTRTSSIRPE